MGKEKMEQLKEKGTASGSFDANINLGMNIRDARMRHNLSIKALAEAAGVTSSLLSQIERGLANPSISTMKAISDALQEPLYNFFLPKVQNHEHLITRAASRERFFFPNFSGITRPDGYECELLNRTESGNLTMLRTKLPARSTSSTIARTHTEDEIAFVTQGNVIIQLGDVREILNEEDCIVIPANVPHRWINETDFPVYIIHCSSAYRNETAGI